MGFDVEYVADIQKFPYPLYTKYKHKKLYGMKFDVLAGAGSQTFDLLTTLPPNSYDLQGITIGVSRLDEDDYWDLICSGAILYTNIYTKTRYTIKKMSPVKRFIIGTDTLSLIYQNTSTNAKTLYVDLSVARRSL
jgi:hypothetical protein